MRVTSHLYRHALLRRAVAFAKAATWAAHLFRAAASGKAARARKLLLIGLATPAEMSSGRGGTGHAKQPTK